MFQNNEVINSDSYLLHGHSIYMHTLKSCESFIDFSTPRQHDNLTEYTGPVANFVFKSSEFDSEISTPGTKFKMKMNVSHSFPIIPGKVTQLPIEVNNDFNKTILTVYQAVLLQTSYQSENNSIVIDPDYMHVYNNTIVLYGIPGSIGSLSFSLSSIGNQEID